MASIKELKKVDLFQSLSDDQLKAIAQLGQEKSFESGEEIFKQGQKAKTLYVLLDGVVTLRIKAEEEIDLMAETLRETGSVFGTASLMNPYISNVTARCLKTTKALAIDSAGFQEILKRDPLMGFEVMTRPPQYHESGNHQPLQDFQVSDPEIEDLRYLWGVEIATGNPGPSFSLRYPLHACTNRSTTQMGGL